MSSSYLTRAGVEKLQKELEFLRTVKRVEVAALLHDSNGSLEFDGDSDPEFVMVKEQQAFIEGRILELEILLSNPTIIDQKSPSGIVEIGSQVKISESGEIPVAYTIVGPTEAAPVDGLISFASPLGSALLGHRSGEEVMVKSPGGIYTVKILEIT
ncbi:MAG: GreA/GreB family elongation factor [Anaerolineales bacterium]|jgi:transcription elongation factor GreA